MGTVLRIFIFWEIYRALYGGRTEVDGITLTMVATSFIISLGLESVFFVNGYYLPDRIRNGSIATELLFFFSLLFSTYGILIIFFTGLRDFGHGGLGIALFVISAGKVGIVWNPAAVFYYIAAVTGGVLIQGAIFLFLASLNIYLPETDNPSYGFWRYSIRFYKSSGN